MKIDLSSAENLIKIPWHHPYLFDKKRRKYSRDQLATFAYDYYLRFLPFFRNQPEGSIGSGVLIEFSQKMKLKLGLADLFNQKIRLNETYFSKDPSLLPYTLFHELVHIWLYDCCFDPGHTWRFYKKMEDFLATGLPVDREVYVHSRIAQEAKFVYVCPSCKNRWFVNEKRARRLSCGPCFRTSGINATTRRFSNLSRNCQVNGSESMAKEFFSLLDQEA